MTFLRSKCFHTLAKRCMGSLNNSHNLPQACYGGRHRVTLLPGDGVGPELMGHVQTVFRYAGVPVDFEEINYTADILDENDHEFENVVLALKRNKFALKGNLGRGIGGVHHISENIKLRTELDIFANVIRCMSIEGVKVRHDDIDIAVIRENTEGEYSSLEHESVPGVVESLKIITKKNSTRIAKYAFDYAVSNGRKKVTCVHKANIMKMGDGLFLESCRSVSKLYPQIEFNDMIVDNCCMQLVSNPQQFDVILLPNLYGNIISHVGVGLVGGSGVVSGGNYGNNYAIFEVATRNTGKSIAGKDVANPTSSLLAGADLLSHIGLTNHSNNIRNAVFEVINKDKITTPDIGGNATSSQVVDAIIARLK